MMHEEYRGPGWAQSLANDPGFMREVEATLMVSDWLRTNGYRSEDLGADSISRMVDAALERMTLDGR